MLHLQRLAVGTSTLALLRPFPAIGRSRSSHSVTPSQAQICLGFWKRPAERAMIPQTSLERRGWKAKWNSVDLRVSQRLIPHLSRSYPLSQTHLSPEFPVSFDRGWPPRPKSSAPASTTSDRPITSHTCSVTTVPLLRKSSRRTSVYSTSVTFSWLSSSLNEARPSVPAITFPRSPTCCNYT